MIETITPPTAPTIKYNMIIAHPKATLLENHTPNDAIPNNPLK